MNRMLQYLMREPGKAAVDALPTDQQLLQQYLDSRDEAAFGELVRRHELSVLKACRQVLRSAVDVDDAFQATFLVLLRRARQVRWQPSLRSWLVAVAHRIAVRLAVSQQRAQQREKNAIPAQSAATPLADVSWQEACSVLHEELNRLPDSFRLPLLLCYLQGYSRDEAAELLGWKLGSVKAGLERGRNQLRVRLERRGVTLSAGLFTMLARPLVSEAVATSLAARTLEAITGTVSARVLSLSRDAGMVGWSLGARGALCVLVLLLGTASGLTLVWAKTPAEAVATAPMAIVSPDHPDAITVTGTVFDPGGKPVTGASILVIKPPSRTSRSSIKLHPPEPGTTTDAQGHFHLTVNEPQFHLVAQKPGYGLDFILVTAEKAKQPLKLQLGEEMPIQGQVLDEAKKPVDGATLGITSVRRYQPQVLEDGLEQVRQTGNSNAITYHPDLDYLLIDLGSLLTTRSDNQGRFILRGLPVGSLLQFMSVKPGLVSRATIVAMLPGFDAQGTTRHHLTPGLLDDAFLKRHPQTDGESLEQTRQGFLQRGHVREFEGATLQISMKRGIGVEGTVRNLKGEPVAGLMVSEMGRYFGHATTDQQGRYRLDDVPSSENYTVQTQPYQGYLAAQASAVHRDAGPIRIDIQVRPGAILKGRVIDGKTGKGVRSYVEVKPTPGNPLLNKPNLLNECSTTTGNDGAFRLIAPPGDIIVTANPDAGSKTTEPMPYVPAKILPSHQRLLRDHRDGNNVSFQGATKIYQLHYAYQLLELPSDGEATVELTISRGKERTLHLVDPQGKPIESALIAGLDQTMLPFSVRGGTHQIVGLISSERNRQLFILNRERKLGAFLAISNSSTDPLTVQLEPLASFTARLIDGANKPRTGLPISIRPESSADRTQTSDLMRQDRNLSMLKDFFPTISTDQDGRFTLPNIIPNMDFRLYSVQPNGVALPNGVFLRTHQLKPDEQRNGGELQAPTGRPRTGTGR